MSHEPVRENIAAAEPRALRAAYVCGAEPGLHPSGAWLHFGTQVFRKGPWILVELMGFRRISARTLPARYTRTRVRHLLPFRLTLRKLLDRENPRLESGRRSIHLWHAALTLGPPAVALAGARVAGRAALASHSSGEAGGTKRTRIYSHEPTTCTTSNEYHCWYRQRVVASATLPPTRCHRRTLRRASSQIERRGLRARRPQSPLSSSSISSISDSTSSRESSHSFCRAHAAGQSDARRWTGAALTASLGSSKAMRLSCT